MLNGRTLSWHPPAGIVVVAALFGLQGCGENIEPMAKAGPVVSIPSECPALLASGRPVLPLDEDERPFFDMSRYVQFPPDDRLLLQRAEVENTRCRGWVGSDSERYRTCNRRDCVMLELEQRDWCWGGGEISAEHRWLRCSKMPDHRPSTGELSFPESEIRAMFPPVDTGSPSLPLARAMSASD
jgi:hypothetical protein